MAYSDKVLDHYENPRNVGTFKTEADVSKEEIGTGNAEILAVHPTVRDPQTGQFLNAKDFDKETPAEPLSGSPLDLAKGEYPEVADPASAEHFANEDNTEFHKQLHTPQRLTLPGDPKARNKALDADPKLKAAVAGKELVLNGAGLRTRAVFKVYVGSLYLPAKATTLSRVSCSSSRRSSHTRMPGASARSISTVALSAGVAMGSERASALHASSTDSHAASAHPAMRSRVGPSARGASPNVRTSCSSS